MRPDEATLDPTDLKSLLRAAVLPPALPLLVLLAGLALLGRRPRLGRTLAWTGFVAAYAFATPVVADVLIHLAERGTRPLDEAAWEAARTGPRPPKALVVLAGGGVVDGPFEPRRERLGDLSLQRIVCGARVARSTGLPVLVTGGQPKWLRRSEAALMRDSLERDLDVPVRWVEERSRDTADNASMSAAMLKAEGIDAVVLVTQAYHMPRSRAAFEAAGLSVVPAPCAWMSGPPGEIRAGDFWPSAHAVLESWLATHELLGRLWYGLRGVG